jgi:hypothetical protein
MTLTATPSTTTGRSTVAGTSAVAAAAALALNSVVGLLAGGEGLDDHSQGLGALSEASAGVAFLAGAVALAVVTPVRGGRAAAWWLAPAGLATAGATMVTVPLTGAEPPLWLFVLVIVPTFVGLVAAGVLGTGRLWPRWVGLGLGAFLPVMFLVPLNGPLLAAIWVGVALALRRNRTTDDRR